jgi:hypothetical protein
LWLGFGLGITRLDEEDEEEGSDGSDGRPRADARQQLRAWLGLG